MSIVFNHTKINNYINILIGIVCFVLLLVPYITVNQPTFDGGKLVNEYILSSNYLLFLFLPFYICWGISLVIKKRFIQLLLISVMLLFVNVYFLTACFILFFAAQDILSNYGVLVSVLLYPLVLAYLIVVYLKK